MILRILPNFELLPNLQPIIACINVERKIYDIPSDFC